MCILQFSDLPFFFFFEKKKKQASGSASDVQLFFVLEDKVGVSICLRRFCDFTDFFFHQKLKVVALLSKNQEVYKQ